MLASEALEEGACDEFQLNRAHGIAAEEIRTTLSRDVRSRALSLVACYLLLLLVPGRCSNHTTSLPLVPRPHLRRHLLRNILGD